MNPAAPHLYVDCDIPDGMTLVDWRRAKHAPARTGRVRRALRLR